MGFHLPLGFYFSLKRRAAYRLGTRQEINCLHSTSDLWPDFLDFLAVQVIPEQESLEPGGIGASEPYGGRNGTRDEGASAMEVDSLTNNFAKLSHKGHKARGPRGRGMRIAL